MEGGEGGEGRQERECVPPECECILTLLTNSHPD